MNNEILIAKCLDLAEGRETPESWWSWWNNHEAELKALLSQGEFLRFKPRKHGFAWLPVFTSQKEAISILEKKGIPFQISKLYQVKYVEELDAYSKEPQAVQQEKQKEMKVQHSDLFIRYPQFPKVLSQFWDYTNEIRPGASLEQIEQMEQALKFSLSNEVREFFQTTSEINLANGVTIGLTRLFTLIIHGERFCVLGEMWKDADGDQLLLCSDEDTIWYYAHEQDLIKPLCSSMIELLEKELPQYLKELNA